MVKYHEVAYDPLMREFGSSVILYSDPHDLTKPNAT